MARGWIPPLPMPVKNDASQNGLLINTLCFVMLLLRHKALLGLVLVDCHPLPHSTSAHACATIARHIRLTC